MPHSRKLRVVLLQLPAADFRGQALLGNVPLAGGYLKAAASQRGLLRDVEIEILTGREANTSTDSELLRLLVARKPDIVAFSIYVWNSIRSLQIARALKHALPGVFVMVGGPEVTPETAYVFDDPAVDVGCIGEGERTFADLLEQQLSGAPDYSQVAGVFYKDGNETIFTPPATPIEDLSGFPSPYALGLIDPQAYPAIPYVGIRGCPHRCGYCTDSNIPMRRFSSERMLQDLQFFAERKIRNVRFWDSDFLLHRPAFVAELAELNRDHKFNLTCFIHVERLNERRADLLRACNFDLVEFGVQSMNPETLENVNRRPLGAERVTRGIELLRERKLRFIADLIFGLPCDTLDDLKRNMMLLGGFGVEEISYAVLILLPGTAVRHRAEEFGIKFEGGPPHRFIEAPYLSREDLEVAKRVIAFEDSTTYRPPFDGLYTVATGVSLLEHSHPSFPKKPRKAPESTIEVADARGRINKVLLELDHESQSASQLVELGTLLSNKVEQPLTLWCKSSDVEKDAPLITALAAPIAAANPFMIWNIILETSRPVSPDVVSEVGRSVPTRETRFDHLQLYRAVSVRVVSPPPTGAEELEWMSALDHSVALYWSVMVSSDSLWRARLSELYEQPGSDGLLIEFEAAADFSTVAEVLKFLVEKRLADKSKELRFRNRAVDFLFHSILSARESEALPSAYGNISENIVSFDRGLEMRSVLSPYGETKASFLGLQLKLASLLRAAE